MKTRTEWVRWVVALAVAGSGLAFATAGAAGAAVGASGGGGGDLEAEVVPGEIVVDLVDDIDLVRLERVASLVGAALTPVSPISMQDKLTVARVAPGRVRAVLDALAREPAVEQAEPSYVYRALFEPNDPRFGEQWHMRTIRAPEAWDLATGKGVTVAVIDTGVAYEKHHGFYQVEDLAGVEFVKPYNFVANSPHANDDHGHGTHVAGTIAQATNNKIGVTGVAHGARIMPLKVLRSDGSGTLAPISHAIRYAADNGAKVINMSLGGPYPSRVLEQACDYAKKKGVLIVCAAGNEMRGQPGYPAAFKSCVAVSATGPDDSLAFYSNYGDKIAIAAPGGDKNKGGEGGGVLQNCINPSDVSQQGYFSFQGTSMAAPHVAGGAALVMSLGVASPDKALAILQDTARKMPERIKYGAGILDCAAAVKKAKRETDKGRIAAALGLAAAVARGVPSPALAAGAIAGALAYPAGSAAVPLVAAMLLFGLGRLRRAIAGVAVGVAAQLAFAALVVPGSGAFEQVWLGINAVVCWPLARRLIATAPRRETGA
jgi:serine protease